MSLDESIKYLISKLDDNPDHLHLDITPAVLELSKLGLEVIPYLKKPLSSEDELTRLHAQRTLEYIIEFHFGFVIGSGWTKPEGEKLFRELWISNGNYDFEAPKEKRIMSIKAWLNWYKNSD